MLIIFDGVDKSGKSTLAKKLSEMLNIPYIKLNNISVKENEEIKDGISIATHSQLETVTQLYEKGVMKNAILDRFYPSEVVYSKLFNRNYDIQYIKQIERRFKQCNDVIFVHTKCHYSILKKRWNNEKLLNKENHLKHLISLYDNFYQETELDVIEIDTSKHEDISLVMLISELSKRGININNARPRRVSHEEAMMNIAKVIAKRGSCLNRQVGAVLTEDGFIVGVGYNGPPSGLSHCKTCVRREIGAESGEKMELSRAIHAEENAIMQSGIRNKSDKDLRLYSTTSPCISCMKKLIQIGVKKIYYNNLYNDELALKMAKEANIEMIKYEI